MKKEGWMRVYKHKGLYVYVNIYCQALLSKRAKEENTRRHCFVEPQNNTMKCSIWIIFKYHECLLRARRAWEDERSSETILR